MNHVHLSTVPEHEQRSPGGKFHSYCRNVSVALGAPLGVGPWGGGHPFDLQVRRIPPGASVCPYHLHHTQWELFVVRAGEGTVRTPEGFHAVKTGDAFIHPPHAAHQLTNTGNVDFEVLIITDNPPFDICHYPDSNKWGGRSFGRIFRLNECDYFDGEEAPVSGITPTPAPPPPAPPAVPPFAQRRVSIDALPWENFDSPKRKFRGGSKGLSESLGALRNTPTGLGGHPFDLELGRVPPGFSSCPYHVHGAQWECYLFLEGQGSFRSPSGHLPIGPGDVVLAPPGDAHQFHNTGATDLLYFLVADNPPLDVWHYPDSEKWGLSAPRKFFRASEVNYWDREE